MLVDWGKLVSLITIAIAATVLTATSHLAPEAGYGILIYLAGYVTGNGRLAVTGKAAAPMIGRAPAVELEEPQP
jgi:hypothetical protein